MRFLYAGCGKWTARFRGSRASLVVGLLMLCFLAGGCSGDALNRQPLSGRVTVDGAPVPNGSIGFEPLQGGGTGSGAVITEGEYSIAREDGLPPGKYRVTITGSEAEQFQAKEGSMPGDEDMPATAAKELIPANWNADGKHDIQVTDSGPNEFNFEIKSK